MSCVRDTFLGNQEAYGKEDCGLILNFPDISIECKINCDVIDDIEKSNMEQELNKGVM